MLLFFLLSGHNAMGQPTFKVRNFGSDSELHLSENVNHIATDNEGHIWITSFDRLEEYDGEKSKYIGLENRDKSGLVRFYQKPNGEKLVIDALNQLFFIEDDTLRAYALNDTLRSLSKGRFCSDFYFDQQNSLHIAFPGCGYLIIDSAYQIEYPLEEKGITFHGMACLFNSDGQPITLKMADKSKPRESQMFFSVMDKNGHVVSQAPIEKPKAGYLNSKIRLPNGNFLLSTRGGDMFEFNASGFIKRIPFKGRVVQLLVDRHGGLWVSTSEGINYYKKGKVDESDKMVLMAGALGAACVEDFQGGIWFFSAESGINYIPSPQCSFLDENEGSPIKDVMALEIVEDHLYYGQYNGELNVIDLEDYTSHKLFIPNSDGVISGLKYDRRHKRLWVCKGGDIFYLNGGQWKKLSDVPGYWLNGRCNGTAYSFVGFRGVHLLLARDTSVTVSEPFPSKIISALAFHDSILIGTKLGTYLQTPDTLVSLTHEFPALKGMVQESAYFDGKVWLSVVGKGLFILKGNQLIPVFADEQEVGGGTFITEGEQQLWLFNASGSYMFSPAVADTGAMLYCVSSYMPLPTFDKGRNTCTGSKAIFADMDKGFMLADFDAIRRMPRVAPELLIERLKVGDNEYQYTDSTFELEHDQNFLQIQYKTVSYQSKGIEFRYRIDGLKEEWIETVERRVELLGLPPGAYAFEVQARLNDQIWSPSEYLQFNIHPPFWERLWFIILVSAVTVVLISQIVNYRIRVSDKEKKLIIEKMKADQKALKAQLNPHFIFNSINSAQYFIHAGKNKEAEVYMNLFSDLARLVLENSEKRMVSLTQEIQLYSSLVELESMVLPNNEQIEMRLDTNGVDTDNTFMPPALLQPYIENAIWHGLKRKKGSKLIELKARREGEGALVITIADNGIGREAAQRTSLGRKKKKSFGMRITSQRVKSMGSSSAFTNSVSIEDLKDKNLQPTGTRIVVKIPYLSSEDEGF